MADTENKSPTSGVNPPTAPAPKTSAATPSLQGVTKPGQGEVKETPPAGEVTLTAANDQENKSSGERAARTGPGISTDSPFRRKMRALERDLEATAEDRSRRGAVSRATINAQLAELRDLEAKRFSGGNVRAPRGNLLMANAVQEQYPDHHLRWVNERAEGRADFLRSIGYERVPDQSGHLSGMALYMIPREQWAKGEVAKQQETERGLRVATGADRDGMLNDLQKHLEKQGFQGDVREIFYSGR